MFCVTEQKGLMKKKPHTPKEPVRGIRTMTKQRRNPSQAHLPLSGRGEGKPKAAAQILIIPVKDLLLLLSYWPLWKNLEVWGALGAH